MGATSGLIAFENDESRSLPAARPPTHRRHELHGPARDARQPLSAFSFLYALLDEKAGARRESRLITIWDISRGQTRMMI